MQVGLDWKGVGDGAQEPLFLQKSLAIYEDGIERFGKKNILFYLNAGKVAESMGDYVKAERYYRAAMTISAADESGYFDLADLYIYKLQKSKAEMLALYAEAEKKVGNKLTVFWARGSYLRRVEDYAGALKDYQTLVSYMPNDAGYKAIIAELQRKLKRK